MTIAHDVRSYHSSIVHDNEYILCEYSVNAPPHALARFGDDVWDLFAWRSSRNYERRRYVVDFRKISDPVQQLVAKEYLYARLNAHVPGHRRLGFGGLRSEFDNLVHFFTYLNTIWNGISLRELTPVVLNGFVPWCQQGKRGSPVNAHTVDSYLSIVTKLVAYKKCLSADAIQFVPWEGRSAYHVAGDAPNDENSTRRIPEKVLHPLIQCALFYVRIAANDILAAQDEIRRFPEQKGTLQVRCARVSNWLAQRRAEQRGVPAHEYPERHHGITREQDLSAVNYLLICRMSGISARTREPEITKMLQQAVAEVGLEPGGMDTPISGRLPTGQPWRGRFSVHSVRHEMRMLVAACYIVITYFSGMRDSEVTNLKRGCHFTESSADGLVTRHKVRGKTFKGRGRQGEAATWVVIQPVADAIAVLELITDRDYLFWPEYCSDSSLQTATVDSDPLLLYFHNHINAPRFNAGLPTIPDVDGRPWRLQSRQFRRTLAWHIANQPFGVVAGKIQYQHVSVVTFEGYAGQSASGFRSEVEAERQLQQIEDLVELYDQVRQGTQLAGPAAPRMMGMLRQVQEQLGDFPGTIVDPARVRAMLMQTARILYPALFNYCFFEPSVARCLPDGNKDQPLLPLCLPDQCPNAVITQQHLQQWQAVIEDAETLAKTQRLPKLQKLVLITSITRWKRVIAPLERASDANQATHRTETIPSDGTAPERPSDTV